MAKHLNRDELMAGLPDILAAPKYQGTLKAIMVRPESEARQDVESIWISLAGGVEGDHWAKGCWMSTDDGKPHPDVQICIMNSRCIDLIAGGRDNWAPAGDNLFIDMDLTPENLPPGTRIAIGEAVLEITATEHNGCAKFVERYGRDATLFVNTGEGKRYRLRGIYGRVVQDGRVTAGDMVAKIRQVETSAA
ncbi:MAG: MOSC domain-containing protein [Alphaproteobacteria bacterium]